MEINSCEGRNLIAKKMKHWYVYIMANKPNVVIYIGVTDNIDKRVKEHKLKLYLKLLQQGIIATNWFSLRSFKIEKRLRLGKDNLRNGKEIGKLN